MQKVLILLMFVLCFSFVSSQIYENCEIYGNCFPVQDEIRPGDIFNITVNQSDYWNTGDRGALRNVADIMHSWLSGLNWSVAGHTMDSTLDMNSNDIDEVNDMIGEGEILFTSSKMGINKILMNSTNPLALSSFRAETDSGAFAALISIGSNFTGANISANDSGIIASGGRLIFVNNGFEDIAFAHVTSGDSNFSNASFSFRLDSQGNAFLQRFLHLQDENKIIRTVQINGGSAMVFQSLDILPSGGFPYVFVAQDSNNNTIVPSWYQNGRNNSFSGQMNSFGLVPKSWVNFTGEPLGNESEGIDFLFNVSDYINYCDYLQNNLSLVPEGCKYFADTTGRLVPLLFGGDLEIHRTATIHEGATVFSNFDYITRIGKDANFIGGDIHLRKDFLVLENLTDFNLTICDFDGGTLCLFVVPPTIQPARDWRNVPEVQCHQDRCARSDGGVLKQMCGSQSTLNATNISLSFWYSLSGGVLDEFYIELDDNQGNVTEIWNDTGTVVDQQDSFLFPQLYENKTNITACFYFDGQNQNRNVWLDQIVISGNFSPAQLINITKEQGKIILGENSGISDECFVHVLFRPILFGPAQKYMNLGCPTSQTVINGTEITMSSLSGSYIGGSAFVCVFDNGTIYTDEAGC